MSEHTIANLIPPTPRPVTRRVSLRSWAEAPVQVWWKSALIVIIVMVGVTIGQIRQYLREQDLLKNGLPVKALIAELGGRKIGTGGYKPARDVELLVKLTGTLPDGKPYNFEGMLPKTEDFAELGGYLDLRIDPNDPTRWIEVREERALWQELMAVFLLTPVALILLAIAQWKRMGVLKVWKNGKVREAEVIDCRHSAMAPRSRICLYTIIDGDDRRVFPTLYPTRRGEPQRGDILDMIVLPDQPGRAVVAEMYLRELES